MQLEEIKYSVLMSVYFKENPQFFKIAINSMLHQTVKPDEIIIVKDGILTNDLEKVLEKFISENQDIFTIVSFDKNMGLGCALRKGVEVARNELIARMDSDDISSIDRCEKQLKKFQEDSLLTVVGTNMAEFIDSINNIISRRVVPEKHDDIIKYLKKRCPLNHVTVMFKKSKILNVGNYIDWHFNEDYYLWIRLYLSGANFYNIQEDLVTVRVGKEMYKRRGGYKYFLSEKKIQDYMFKNRIINIFTYIDNICKRFVLQVLMPNSLRGIIFKKFARKNEIK